MSSTPKQEDKLETVEIEENALEDVNLTVNTTEEEEQDELSRAEKLQQPCPENSANFFSRMTFWWFNGMVSKGFQKPLQIEDMYKLRPMEEAELLSDRFEYFWNEVKTQAAQKGNKTPSLLLTIHRAFGLRFYLCAILKIIYDISELSLPLFIKWIIQYMQDTSSPIYMGYVICAILFLVQMIAMFAIQQYFHIVMTQGMRVRTALRTAVYKKTLNLSSQARQKLNTGDITNFMSIDSAKVGDTLTYLHMIWSAVFQITVCLFFLFQLLGWSAIAGLVVILILIPVNTVLTRIVQTIRRQILKVTGERIKIINEILQGIRVIKFYAWEGSFLQKALKSRSEEISKLRCSQWIQVLLSTANVIGPLLVSIFTFMLYAGLGYNLDPAIIFPALTYFSLLRFPMMFLPTQITAIAEAKVSLDRINGFLLCDEVTPREQGNDYDPIVIKGGTFTWENTNIEDHEIKQLSFWERFKSMFGKPYGRVKEDSVGRPPIEDKQHNQQADSNSIGKPLLRDINIRIPKGKLTCVVGAVGSGKSSFLQAIVGEMKQIEGETVITGSIAYTTQQAWIQNATVKNNITFGMPLNSEKYYNTISCCALENDIRMLPAGDKTEIGEKGINLSGGQRQRVSLARAVYSDTDIILLDDPLSAVDAHVGKHIFEKCVCGVLSNKTRILVTHQLHYLKRADYIILFADGQISERGTFDELMESNGTFSQMIRSYTSHEEDEKEHHDETETSEPQKVELKKIDAKLIQQEERVTGSVKSSVYRKYINYGGGWLLVIVLTIIFVVAQLVQVGNNWWLARWTEDNNSAQRIAFYLIIYSGLGVASALFQLAREILFTIFGLRAAYKLHEKALTKVMHAPTSFFDTTPVGRIINRFSKDTESTDSTLIATLKMFINCVLNILSICVVIIYATPLFIIPLIPICILYYRVQQYYRHTSREIQRLESIYRSPMFAHFSETLSGLPTIRAYDRKQAFQMENWRRLDTNNKAAFGQLVSTRWLGIRLEFAGRFIVFIAALLCVISRTVSTMFDLGFFTLAAGMAGLSLSYASQITGQLNWAVRMATDTEASFSSVERVLYYCEEVEQEADMIIQNNRPPQDWPDKGEIKFNKVVLRYRKDLEPVLKGLSVNIIGAEKVGIVGRTGAGKSTLMIGLFRLVELESGFIEIDGLDISQIGLEDLRSRIAIIPQDPVLFSGTVRFNLDPFYQYDDIDVWRALERVHMRDKLERQPASGLQTMVSEGGDNFSVGERQLICIARALLRRTKLLVMDEATANVDLETDTLIQQTIRAEFSDRTVLTIAHRLNTIIDSDKILVMDKGQLAEFDNPSNLLMNPTTIFHSLVNETGKANANFLKRIAMGELDYVKELSNTLATRTLPQEQQ